jgi:hypothetical protein
LVSWLCCEIKWASAPTMEKRSLCYDMCIICFWNENEIHNRRERGSLVLDINKYKYNNNMYLLISLFIFIYIYKKINKESWWVWVRWWWWWDLEVDWPHLLGECPKRREPIIPHPYWVVASSNITITFSFLSFIHSSMLSMLHSIYYYGNESMHLTWHYPIQRFIFLFYSFFFVPCLITLIIYWWDPQDGRVALAAYRVFTRLEDSFNLKIQINSIHILSTLQTRSDLIWITR